MHTSGKINAEHTGHTRRNMVKLEIHVPATHLEQVCDALRRAGVGAFGHYDSTLSYSLVRGRWRPLPGAKPYDGEVGQLCERDEYKIEACCPVEIIDKAMVEIKAAHPYEVPSICVIQLLMTSMQDV